MTTEPPRPPDGDLALLGWLATRVPPEEEVASVAAMFGRVERHVPFAPGTVARATAGGACADRLGYAFAAGYREALAFLVPETAGSACALCATEEGGAHPRAILTRFEGGTITGTKSWVTLGSAAKTLLVVASRGTEEQAQAGRTPRNLLVVARVPRDRAGVTLRDRDPAPFAPEIPHAEATFDRVAVGDDEILPGDGYERWLKPFRTVEDLFVMGALLGYVAAVASRTGAARAWLEEALAVVIALEALEAAARARPDGAALGDPALHLALAGAIAAVRDLVARDTPWAAADTATRQRWERDRRLLDVAGTARHKRAEAAWRRLRP